MNFLKLLMLILQIWQKLPKSSRERIRAEFSFRDLIDIFRRVGGGGAGGSGEGGGDAPWWVSLIMLILRLLSEVPEEHQSEVAMSLNAQVEKMVAGD